MHGVRAVFKYGGDESGREIGGDILDVELLSSDPFPKSGQSIGRLALTHMENPTALEVNDNGLVHMPFSDGKLVYADTVHSLKRGWSILTLKMMSVNPYDRVPRHTQKMGCVFEGHGNVRSPILKGFGLDFSAVLKFSGQQYSKKKSATPINGRCG